MLNGERIGLPHSLLLSVLQEEERERRMDYIPEESAINVENIEVCDEGLNSCAIMLFMGCHPLMLKSSQ